MFKSIKDTKAWARIIDVGVAIAFYTAGLHDLASLYVLVCIYLEVAREFTRREAAGD